MASIIKNQLLKHLSRFTKNLSADKINLSTFKGEGELSNLELNEIVLTDLLELPSWLRITKAWCNKVAFKIPWRKLKSVPMLLNLDEVNIIVETCEELRPMTQSGLAADLASGEYGFIHKVIDGITITVNTVNILFNSPAFTASVQISRILVESKTCKWAKSADLRYTRLKDPEKGQLLLFKELEWQTVRIEAKSTIDKNLTPLRLLTNTARCRIVIKKRLKDCFIMGSKLVIILDDLLWVLTDSQLKAALHFLDSLAGLIQKATLLTRKTKAARKLEEFPELQTKEAKKAKPVIFDIYDVIETSYHFLSNNIVLHLCDDPGTGRSIHPNLKDGGALQICVKHFQIDFYPYHLAKASRKHWPRYNDTSIPHCLWQEQALNNFKGKFMDLLDFNKKHTPLSRKTNFEDFEIIQHPDINIKRQVEQRFAKLMTSCVIMRIEDFTLYKVTTSGKKQQLKEFISAQQKRNKTGDRDHMSLPKDASIIHAEFIYYYYTSDTPFPLPPPKFYVQLNPIQVIFDMDSCLWLNSFGLNLYQSLMAPKKQIKEQNNLTYIDVKIESILPRILFESNVDYQNQKDRPKTLCFQVTRVTITNVRSLEYSSRADLAKCVDSFHMGSLFFGSEFPSKLNDFYVVTQKFMDHISANDNIRHVPKQLDTTSLEVLVEQLSRELLWTEAKDVWCISLDPIWGDFVGARAINKPVPFLDAIPITIWIHTNMDPNSTIITNDNSQHSYADLHALAYISNLVSLQLNHYQFLFLLRLAEELGELMTFLSIDSNRILKVESSGSIVVGALIPQLEITFVMPSQCPGKESSGGDVESFIPDTLSIADDNAGSCSNVWKTSQLSITQQQKVPLSNGNTLSHSLSVDLTKEIDESKTKQFTITNNFNMTSMKKGFNNLMTSFDNAFKPSFDNDNASDCLSIRSDASSDSDLNTSISNFDSDNNLDIMFYVREFSIDNTIGGAPIELASEVIEDDSTITTTSEHSFISNCPRKDLISVSTFKLSKVEVLQQSVGYSSSIKVQISDVCCDDCSSIPWDEFQSKFNTRSRAWTEQNTNGTNAKIKLRLDHNLQLPSTKSMQQLNLSDKNYLKKLFKDLVTININDLIIDLTMSTITGLTDLIEDEVYPIPIPLEINLDNVKLHLIEDRPPINITSPGPIPVDLNITTLYITRNENGIFNIYPYKSDEIGHGIEMKRNNQLEMEIEELKRRLQLFERISNDNRNLRKAKEENDLLKQCLQQAQDENSRLLDEKKRLLDEMKFIKEQQKQVMQVNRQQWTGNKR